MSTAVLSYLREAATCSLAKSKGDSNGAPLADHHRRDWRMLTRAATLVARQLRLKHWYVDGFGSWFVVEARTKQQARSQGVKDFGRGGVKDVRLATSKEVAEYERIMGRVMEVDE